MNERIRRLREESFSARPSFSAERALLTTEFYREWLGKVSTPVLRAMNFRNLCERKAIWIGEGDRKSTRLNSSHVSLSRMPSSA